jgi:hypothetical protein
MQRIAKEIKRFLRLSVCGHRPQTGVRPRIYPLLTCCVAFALTAQAQDPSVTFSFPNLGGVSLPTSGTSDSLAVGYGRIVPAAGTSTLSGVAIFGNRQNDVLVSEAGVPVSPPVQSGRIWAEVNGPVNTGLAIANPNSQSADITFFFKDSAGVDFGLGTFRLEPNEQIARFLNEDPFNGGSGVLGTFTFTSSVPVSIIALRGFMNERSEFLMTTLPVAAVTANSDDSLIMPHFADGSGWTTQVILINPTDQILSGTVQFRSPVPLRRRANR